MSDAVQLIATLGCASADDDAAFHNLFDTEDGAAAALKLLVTKPEGGPLQAALAIYRSAAADPAPFHPYLTHPSATIRVIAGCGAVERGDAAGFAPLIEILDSDEKMTWSRPPQDLWRKALDALVMATGIADFGPPLDASLRARVRARKLWSDWLATKLSALRFDPVKGEWK